MRDSVRLFAEVMEKRLQENKHKCGWENDDPDWLVSMAQSNINTYDHGGDILADRPSLVDAANYLMMAWENVTKWDMARLRKGRRD